MNRSTAIKLTFGLYLLIVLIVESTTLDKHDEILFDEPERNLDNNEAMKSKHHENLKELRRLQHSLAQVSVFKSQIDYEDVAIFIGTTKSGKSTLINYLLGNRLIGSREQFTSVFVAKADDSPGPQIGKDLASETSIPTKWKSTKSLTELALWDTPGFQDNRGPSQDIANAFYIKELFQNVKSAKIVIVSDIHDVLSDRINAFISLLNSIEYLFNEHFKDCFSSIIIVFTKVHDDFDGEPLTVEYISNLLKHKISSTSSIKISPLIKEFLEHLSVNRNQIAFFKKAKIGPITTNDGVIEAIKSVEGKNHENLVTVSPSVASSSQVFLFEIRHNVTSIEAFAELNKIIHNVFERMLNEIVKDINDNSKPSELKMAELDLREFQNKIKGIIEKDSSFHQKISELQGMSPVLQHKIDEENLVEKSKIKEFIDELLKLKEGDIFNVNLRSIMQGINYSIESTLIKIKELTHEINAKAAKIELDKIKSQSQEEIVKRDQEYERLLMENNKARGVFSALGGAIDTVLGNIFKLIMK